DQCLCSKFPVLKRLAARNICLGLLNAFLEFLLDLELLVALNVGEGIGHVAAHCHHYTGADIAQQGEPPENELQDGYHGYGSGPSRCHDLPWLVSMTLPASENAGFKPVMPCPLPAPTLVFCDRFRAKSFDRSFAPKRGTD